MADDAGPASVGNWFLAVGGVGGLAAAGKWLFDAWRGRSESSRAERALEIEERKVEREAEGVLIDRLVRVNEYVQTQFETVSSQLQNTRTLLDTAEAALASAKVSLRAAEQTSDLILLEINAFRVLFGAARVDSLQSYAPLPVRFWRDAREQMKISLGEALRRDDPGGPVPDDMTELLRRIDDDGGTG